VREQNEEVRVPTHPERPARSATPAESVRAAVGALAEGRMVIVVDDHDRENEGDLVLAADRVTPAQMAFVVAHTTGIVCTPMSDERADALDLPVMVADNQDAHGTAFTVTVDHVDTGTGVSASARARTCRGLADPATVAGELRRPGHVFPLRARDGGVLVRAGHTEAAVDLLRLAGRETVGVISELVGDDGEMLRARRSRRSPPSTTCRSWRSRTWSATGGPPSSWSSRSRARRCRQRSATSAPLPTARAWTGPNISPS
jgi:3,4-dihydroxy-2-butanone 4-phosphate synthase